MLEAEVRSDGSSVEVLVIPGKHPCGALADIRKAELAPGGALLGCLDLSGTLLLWDPLWDPADREAAAASAAGSYLE